MGQESIKAVSEDPELELVAQTDLGDNLAESIDQSKAQVVVDFTTAASALKNTVCIIESGARPVIGTSGLLPEEISELQALCTKNNLGGIIAPNFAIGAVLMMEMARLAAPHLDHVEVIELHHDQKIDAPSGTATRTVELIVDARAGQAIGCPERHENNFSR